MDRATFDQVISLGPDCRCCLSLNFRYGRLAVRQLWADQQKIGCEGQIHGNRHKAQKLAP
jgi:hypothetical protein